MRRYHMYSNVPNVRGEYKHNALVDSTIDFISTQMLS